jgi:metalloendopeptidase OMA1, mitochondrial
MRLLPVRRLRWRPALSGAIVAASMVAACETVPYTGRSQLQFMSPQQETQLGVQAYQQTLAKARLSSDAVASEMVTRVGSRIAAVTAIPNTSGSTEAWIPEAMQYYRPR